MFVSIIVTARNEAPAIRSVIARIEEALEAAKIHYECVVVDDGSQDATGAILDEIASVRPRVRVVHRTAPNGLGLAVRSGLEHAHGEGIIIAMGDGSDDPKDIVRFVELLQEGYGCVFGSRFRRLSRVEDYPGLKLVFNRLGNFLIQALFRVSYNDVTNAFKAYHSSVIREMGELESTQFEITIELPIKALKTGCRIVEVPNHWYGRTHGRSHHSLRRAILSYVRMVLRLRFEKVRPQVMQEA